MRAAQQLTTGLVVQLAGQCWVIVTMGWFCETVLQLTEFVQGIPILYCGMHVSWHFKYNCSVIPESKVDRVCFISLFRTRFRNLPSLRVILFVAVTCSCNLRYVTIAWTYRDRQESSWSKWRGVPLSFSLLGSPFPQVYFFENVCIFKEICFGSPRSYQGRLLKPF